MQMWSCCKAGRSYPTEQRASFNDCSEVNSGALPVIANNSPPPLAAAPDPERLADVVAVAVAVAAERVVADPLVREVERQVQRAAAGVVGGGVVARNGSRDIIVGRNERSDGT